MGSEIGGGAATEPLELPAQAQQNAQEGTEAGPGKRLEIGASRGSTEVISKGNGVPASVAVSSAEEALAVGKEATPTITEVFEDAASVLPSEKEDAALPKPTETSASADTSACGIENGALIASSQEPAVPGNVQASAVAEETATAPTPTPVAAVAAARTAVVAATDTTSATVAPSATEGASIGAAGAPPLLVAAQETRDPPVQAATEPAVRAVEGAEALGQAAVQPAAGSAGQGPPELAAKSEVGEGLQTAEALAEGSLAQVTASTVQGTAPEAKEVAAEAKEAAPEMKEATTASAQEPAPSAQEAAPAVAAQETASEAKEAAPAVAGAEDATSAAAAPASDRVTRAGRNGSDSKHVQWCDDVGLMLTTVKEFDPSEDGDGDPNSNADMGCNCTIL